MSKSKKAYILGILMVGVLLITSCASGAEIEETSTDSFSIDGTTADLTYGVEKTEVVSLDEIVYSQEEGDVIIPPSIYLRGCNPGMTGRWETKVYNSAFDAVVYTTMFRYPDLNHLNADAPPSDIKDWITIENPTVRMEGQSEGVFNYRIDIPEDADLPEVSEFWIVIKKADQLNFVQWEVILRCYLYRGD